MEVALLKVDLSETFDAIKSAVANADKRVLSILGFAVGSYMAYEALESVSMAGKTENTYLRKLHEFVREYYNRGYLIRRRHFFSDPRACVVNYGSYGVLPRPVFEYKIKLEVILNICSLPIYFTTTNSLIVRTWSWTSTLKYFMFLIICLCLPSRTFFPNAVFQSLFGV